MIAYAITTASLQGCSCLIAYDARAVRFLESLSGTHIWDITDRPLLLAMPCTLYDEGNELPKFKVDIYRECAELACRRWDAYRDVERESVFRDLSTHQKLLLLGAIAAEMSLVGLTELPSAQWVFRVRQAMEDNSIEGSAERLLHELISHTGLISETYLQRLSFSHKSFQEYFSALQFSQSNPLIPLRKFQEDSQWLPIVEMTASMMSDSSPLLFKIIEGIERKDEKKIHKQLEILYQLIGRNPLRISQKGRMKIANKILWYMREHIGDGKELVVVREGLYRPARQLTKKRILFERTLDGFVSVCSTEVGGKEPSRGVIATGSFVLRRLLSASLTSNDKLLAACKKDEEWRITLLSSIFVSADPNREMRDFSARNWRVENYIWNNFLLPAYR